MSIITTSRYKIIKDPVHGYIKIYNHELKIIDTYAFQRLRRLKQLAVADLVYPGAVHTRFHHSLGVAHISETIVREALRKLRLNMDDVERYVVISRIIALLHDIGHGPYSHTFEDYILYPRSTTHEIIGARIIEEHQELAEALDKVLSEYGYRIKDLSQAIKSTSVEEWPFSSSITGDANEKALFYILKGAFGADLIDYLLRDSYYTGAGYGSGIDWYRIAHFTYIEGDKLVIDAKALEVFDQMLIARLHMFSTVYYHKTVRAASRFVGDILRRIDELKLIDFNEAINNVEKYLLLDDYSILFNSNVTKLPEIYDFLSRRIPYKAIAEHRITLPELASPLEVLLSMSKNYVESMIEEKIRSRGLELIKDRDFFIDTPKLPLNPMLGDEIIYIRDNTGYIYKRRVLELTWFHIPRSVSVIRLYIHRSKTKEAEKLRTIFREIFEGGELRSFY